MVARRKTSQHKQSSRESRLRCSLILRDHRAPCSYVSPYPDIPSFCGRWRKWRAIPQWLRNWDSTVMDLATVATSWKKLTLFETCHCLPATMISNSIAMTCWQVVSQEPALPTELFLGDDMILNMPQWERIKWRLDHFMDCCIGSLQWCLLVDCLQEATQYVQRCFYSNMSKDASTVIDNLRTIKHWPPNLF